MKFFTPELFARLNSEDENVVDQAEEQWEAARKDYQAYFHSIEAKLPKSLVKLCKRASLHDGRIQPSSAILTVHETDDAGERSSAIICVEHAHAVFDLVYLDTIEPTLQTHPVDAACFYPENVTWLYDELSCANQGYFSHEILLSNGNLILVRFKGFKYAERLSLTPQLLAAFDSAPQRKSSAS